jgi:CheY-like chemotaxis protein
MKIDSYAGPAHPSPMEGRNEFLTVLAHELRNHVGPIGNAVHLLRMRGGSDPNFQPMLEMIERQVAAIVREIDVIVEAERASRGDLRIESDKIDVGAVVTQAVERARPEALRRRQTLRAAQTQAPIPAYGDPARLAQVLHTVLDNAMRYTGDGGDILVAVEPTAERVAIRVRDTGIGIAADFLPRAFDYFSAPGQSGHGVGVGLAVARKLMEMQGGSIRASSAGPGAGSEFVIELPIARPEARVREGGNANPAIAGHDARDNAPFRGESTTGGSGHRARRVLVADDSAAVCESLSNLLQDLGHDVQSARDGEEALELAQRWQPDFVLLDIHMPKQNGFVVAKALRARFSSEKMKLVMMSGNNLDDATLAGAKAAGFDTCIDKVFAFSELEKLLASATPQTG